MGITEKNYELNFAKNEVVRKKIKKLIWQICSSQDWLRSSRMFRMYVYQFRRKNFSPKLVVSVFRDESDGDYREKLRVSFAKNGVDLFVCFAIFGCRKSGKARLRSGVPRNFGFKNTNFVEKCFFRRSWWYQFFKTKAMGNRRKNYELRFAKKWAGI